MSQKAKAAAPQPMFIIDGEVVRQIRQHARSSPKAEICGVLIGKDRSGHVEVQASIAGAKAEEAGAHVTFTQDTWEHIYQIKDREYPNERIVGWYHSHPGFGVFLSDHDTFIHQNFFSSPGQVAWVFDPHSDEEGCFGWVDGHIERLARITVSDHRGGERAAAGGNPGPLGSVGTRTGVGDSCNWGFEQAMEGAPDAPDSSASSLARLVRDVFACLTFLLLGFMIAWYVFPRVEVVPVPVDPTTGKPLSGYSLDATQGNRGAEPPPSRNGGSSSPPAAPNSNGSKENLVQSR